MRFGWQVLLPLAVLNALVTAVVVAFGWDWWVSGLAGLGILVAATAAYYIRQRGSRARKPGTDVQEMPPSVRLVDVRATEAPAPSDGAGIPRATEVAPVER